MRMQAELVSSLPQLRSSHSVQLAVSILRYLGRKREGRRQAHFSFSVLLVLPFVSPLRLPLHQPSLSALPICFTVTHLYLLSICQFLPTTSLSPVSICPRLPSLIRLWWTLSFFCALSLPGHLFTIVSFFTHKGKQKLNVILELKIRIFPRHLFSRSAK